MSQRLSPRYWTKHQGMVQDMGSRTARHCGMSSVRPGNHTVQDVHSCLWLCMVHVRSMDREMASSACAGTGILYNCALAVQPHVVLV